MDYYTLDSTMTLAPKGETAHPGLDRHPGFMLVRAWGTVPAEGFHAALAVEDPAEFTAAAFKGPCAAAALLSPAGLPPGTSTRRARASSPARERSR